MNPTIVTFSRGNQLAKDIESSVLEMRNELEAANIKLLTRLQESIPTVSEVVISISTGVAACFIVEIIKKINNKLTEYRAGGKDDNVQILIVHLDTNNSFIIPDEEDTCIEYYIKLENKELDDSKSSRIQLDNDNLVNPPPKKYGFSSQIFPNWITAIAVSITAVISILVIYKSCETENKTSAYEFRPKLRLLKPINVNDFLFVLDTLALEDDTLNILVRPVKFGLNLKAINVDSEQANFLGMITADTLKGTKNWLRQIFFDEVFREKIKSKSEHFEEFFRFHTILPSDTLPVDLSKEIYFLGENPVFCIHLLLLYENDFGHIYDTYALIALKPKSIPIGPSGEGFGKISIKDINFDLRQDWQVYYRKSELKQIREFIEGDRLN
ncbi:hypothetical protein KKA00_03110 [bacterium]|nr:hypothetical protein [bacterium]MBU1651185.1 hypothetical protein [bacterium]